MTNCNQDPRSLITAHMPRVDQLTLDADARQRGYFALCRLARRWRGDGGATFWTYVHPAVLQAIRGRRADRDLSDGTPVPEQTRDGDTAAVELADVVAHLPAYLQPVAELLLAGYSQRAIARQTGISHVGIQKRVEKIRHLLRRYA